MQCRALYLPSPLIQPYRKCIKNVVLRQLKPFLLPLLRSDANQMLCRMHICAFSPSPASFQRVCARAVVWLLFSSSFLFHTALLWPPSSCFSICCPLSLRALSKKKHIYGICGHKLCTSPETESERERERESEPMHPPKCPSKPSLPPSPRTPSQYGIVIVALERSHHNYYK